MTISVVTSVPAQSTTASQASERMCRHSDTLTSQRGDRRARRSSPAGMPHSASVGFAARAAA